MKRFSSKNKKDIGNAPVEPPLQIMTPPPSTKYNLIYTNLKNENKTVEICRKTLQINFFPTFVH